MAPLRDLLSFFWWAEDRCFPLCPHITLTPLRSGAPCKLDSARNIRMFIPQSVHQSRLLSVMHLEELLNTVHSNDRGSIRSEFYTYGFGVREKIEQAFSTLYGTKIQIQSCWKKRKTLYTSRNNRLHYVVKGNKSIYVGKAAIYQFLDGNEVSRPRIE